MALRSLIIGIAILQVSGRHSEYREPVRIELAAEKPPQRGSDEHVKELKLAIELSASKKSFRLPGPRPLSPQDLRPHGHLRPYELDLNEETEAPAFTAFLINNGTQPVTIALPGDGSLTGWRTPVIRWTPKPKKGVAICGNIDALKPEEVIVLRPGRRVELKQIHMPTLDQPGKHVVSLEMEHVPKLQWRGVPLGKHDASAMQAIRKSKGFKVLSNSIEVEVLPAAISK